MTRAQQQTLQTLRHNASHTHPGTVGQCRSWECPDFLDVVGATFKQVDELVAELAILNAPVAVDVPALPTKKSKK